MSHYRTSALFGMLAVASAFLAVAQAPNNTGPASASSPAQRSATSSTATEAPATNNSEPSAASTPHQQQVTANKKQMKDCMAKEKARDSTQSKDQMKKTCLDQTQSSKPT